MPLRGCRLIQLPFCPRHLSTTCATAFSVLSSSLPLQLRSAADGGLRFELWARSGRTRHRKSFAVSSFTHVAVAASFVEFLGMSALTILTDFCLSVSEGDGVTGVVMFAPSSQDPNLSGRYSLSERVGVRALCTGHVTQLLWSLSQSIDFEVGSLVADLNFKTWLIKQDVIMRWYHAKQSGPP